METNGKAADQLNFVFNAIIRRPTAQTVDDKIQTNLGPNLSTISELTKTEMNCAHNAIPA